MTDAPTFDEHYQALGQRLNESRTWSVPGHIVRRLAVVSYPGPVEYVDRRIESTSSRTLSGEIVVLTPVRVVQARFTDAPTFEGGLDPGITATVDVICTSRRTLAAIEFPASVPDWRNVDRAWGELREGGYVKGLSVVLRFDSLALTLPLDLSSQDADARLFALLPSLLNDLDRTGSTD